MKRYKIVIAFCLFPLSLAFGQEIIKGKVLTPSNAPLKGVVIQVGENGQITQTNAEGEFEIPDVRKGQVLTFRLEHYDQKQVTVGDNALLNIILAETPVNNIEEVVMTGYIKQKKADITGAVSVVSMDELNKQTEPNPIQALQGRVPGVNITTDGAPSGGNTKILIRGVGTLNSTDPLFVIDGVPTKGGMHELNPNDIETMQVLKDAASASIYGSRAANGVIIITTKSGKKGRMRINANYYTSLSDYATKTKVLDAQGFGEVLWKANVNDGIDPNSNNVRYKFDWNEDYNNPVLKNIIIPEFLDSEHTLKSSNTDWFKEIARTGVVNSADVSVANGSDKGTYFFSMGYYKNKGIVKYTDFQRVSARINTTYNLLKGKLRIGENFTVNRTNEVQDPGVLDPALRALPIVPVHTVDGIGWGGPVTGMNDRQNPVRLLVYNKDNRYKYLRLFGNAFVELTPIKHLVLRSNLGIDYSTFDRRDLQKTYVSGFLRNDKNAVTLNHSMNDRVMWSNTAQYTNTFGLHDIDVLIGTEIFRETIDNSWLRREGFLVETPNYMYPDAGTGEAFNGGSSSRYSLLSYFGKINYNYGQRYLFSATVRRDGSSRFGDNHRFGTFPAFSFGWRINKEEFMTDVISSLSDLRLRFSWGQTGNQEISNTAIYSLYLADYAGGDPTWAPSLGTAYDITGASSGLLGSGFILTQRGNDNLKWETTTQTNLGIDFGFFNQKLTGSLDVYNKKTRDILVSPPYLGVIGEGGARWLNGASMENKGIELSLGYQNRTESWFGYDFSANLAFNKNKITKLPDDVKNSYGGDGLDNNILGRPINSMYGYVAEGLFHTQEEVDASPLQSGKGLGRIKFKDINNDGVIDDKDRDWIGDPNPNFMYGFNLNFSYKNFDLSTFWQGVADVDVINQKKFQTDFWSVDDVGSNKGARLLRAWSPDNVNSTIPALTTIDNNAENRFSTYYVENGNYLKLRMLQFGYTLSDNLANRIGIQSLRFYLSAQNIWTIKSKSFTGVDPETPAFGYPIPRVFSIGFNLSM